MPCMLRTTTAFTLGMHAAALLARNFPAKIPVKKIAELCGASEAHLAKVIQTLARKGIVKGERGPAGGVSLDKSPETVSLMMLWEAIEGDYTSAKCPFTVPSCTSGICSLGNIFGEHNRQIEQIMKTTTLKGLDCMGAVWNPEKNVTAKGPANA